MLIHETVIMGVFRFIIFWPQGDVEELASILMPNENQYPVGTWIYDKTRSLPGCGWIQLVQYTLPNEIKWEYYADNAKELNDVTPMMKMYALVMS